MPTRLDIRDSGFEDNLEALMSARREAEANVDDVVADILAEVRKNGDSAVIDYTQRFDLFQLTPETMRIGADEVNAARAACDTETLDAMELAAVRISDFHSRQMPNDLDYVDSVGLRLGQRWRPIAAAGLYVPGGTAAYPSSVLMNALPAKVAGVERLVMTVPTPDGALNPLVLAAAQVAGVDEIYRIGGAQAVGALAYGTRTIAPVDKIVGPGNAYVTAAKRQVFGAVGIDMIAGPSEILVVADRLNDPVWIAADLLSQAEHDVSAQAILITDDADFADAVAGAVDDHLVTLPRAGIASQSWSDFGALIVVETLEQAAPIIDRIAPEHLELAVEDADSLADRVRNAGSIFLGRFTPEAIGDYVAGPNHVLPTARSARFSSGLGTIDFLKRSTLIGADRKSLDAVGPAAVLLAETEGLGAHALSVALRLNRSHKI